MIYNNPALWLRKQIDPVFANNTWAAIITACQSGNVPDSWAVGDSKMMTINGTDYQIDIIGKDHDTYTAGGTAPLTFQLHDCYGTTYAMNNSNTTVGGWNDCEMRNTHLPAILALMPTEVQSGIRKVNKMTSSGNGSTTINTTADNLFLLSEIEIFGSTTYSANGEGTQYAYYKDGNSTIKKLGKKNVIWWERSPNFGNSSYTYFCYVYNYAGEASGGQASINFGVSFSFCF